MIWEQEFKTVWGIGRDWESLGFLRVRQSNGARWRGIGWGGGRGWRALAVNSVPAACWVCLGEAVCVWNSHRWWCRVEGEQCHISPVPSHGFLLELQPPLEFENEFLWALQWCWWRGFAAWVVFKEQTLPACFPPLLEHHPWGWCEQPSSHRTSAERVHFSMK